MSKASKDPLAVMREFEPHGILLDTNLLLIYIVGICNRNFVGKVKRTEHFRPEDALFLIRRLSRYKRRVTTPGIWVEVSNLLEPFFKSLPVEALRSLKTAIAEEITILDEQWIPTREIIHDDQLLRYGFTDLAIAAIAQNNVLILTADFPLADLLYKRRLPCVNYHTLRIKLP